MSAGPVRQVNITANPSVPGGPRALPGRVLRSQTVNEPVDHTPFSVSRPIQSVTPPTVMEGSTPLEPVQDIQADPDFTNQVEHLAILLPQAERDVLAGYLRRAAGQDMLAIGQYLEDEKKGTIRLD